jgi:hypothetical protein
MHKVWEYLIIIVVQVEAVKIHVAAVESLTEKERGDETQFTTTKVGGKTSLGPSYFVPSYAFDALLCRNWLFSPPNRLTLRITLVGVLFFCEEE